MKKLKIVFVIDRIGLLEIFSIPILSSLAKRQGHHVKVVEFSPNPKRAGKKIISWNPDIVAYSISSNEAERYLEINKTLKSGVRFFSLFGGPHPTFFPDFIKKEGVDAICRGEGDICFPVLLENFNTDRMYETSNFSFKKGVGKIIENSLAPLMQNLGNLPFPDRDIIFSQSYFLANNPIKTFIAGRGCPFNCSYCFNQAFNEMYKGGDRILRTKSVAYLFDEIKTVANKYPLTFIKFHDDIFGIDQKWLAEFADRYPREINLPFLCYARPDLINEDYCRQLKKAGCYPVCMGVECGNEQIRSLILNRKITDKQITSACEVLKKFGIRVYTLNMVGLPGESDNDIFQTIKLNQRLRIDFTDALVFQPYPGTQINKYCEEKGYLDKGVQIFESQCSTSILNLEPDFKDRIYMLQRLFPILVDYPYVMPMLKFLYIIKKIPLFRKILNFVYRLYYGFFLHRRIYASKIPLTVRIWGGFLLLISKNRV